MHANILIQPIQQHLEGFQPNSCERINNSKSATEVFYYFGANEDIETQKEKIPTYRDLQSIYNVSKQIFFFFG